MSVTEVNYVHVPVLSSTVEPIWSILSLNAVNKHTGTVHYFHFVIFQITTENLAKKLI